MPTLGTWNTGSTLVWEDQPGLGLNGNVCEAGLAQRNPLPATDTSGGGRVLSGRGIPDYRTQKQTVDNWSISLSVCAQSPDPLFSYLLKLRFFFFCLSFKGIWGGK